MKRFFRRPADGARGIPAIGRILLLICIASTTATRLNGQATPTAERDGNLQIGAMFNLASSDYSPNKFKGYGLYTTFDFQYHLGIEGEFHQVNDPNSTGGVYERTYEIGPRYVLRHQRYNPYAKVLYGRGVFNYPSELDSNGKIEPTANLAYNIGAIGGGLDYIVRPRFKVRVDYEYQSWFGFPLHGLTPQVFGIGVAYRFH
jgi:opacity protein-like surface antigen